MFPFPPAFPPGSPPPPEPPLVLACGTRPPEPPPVDVYVIPSITIEEEAPLLKPPAPIVTGADAGLGVKISSIIRAPPAPPPPLTELLPPSPPPPAETIPIVTAPKVPGIVKVPFDVTEEDDPSPSPPINYASDESFKYDSTLNGFVNLSYKSAIASRHYILLHVFVSVFQ